MFRSKIDVEELKEEGVLYWPISALRLLILAKSRPGDWSILQRMLGHRYTIWETGRQYGTQVDNMGHR